MFAEARKKLPNVGDGLRLSTGTVELSSYMETMICDPPINFINGSNVIVLIRQKGGSDPRIQMLHNCDNKTVVGVTTPSIRACPHCGALVQHTADCKHMNCPACKQDFCFICLKTKTVGGSWQCGSYNDMCTPASRQTRIPG